VAGFIDVEGVLAGETTEIRVDIAMPYLRRSLLQVWGANQISFATGVGAAAYAKAILDGKVTRRGLFPPEVLDTETRSFVIAEAERRGYSISRRRLAFAAVPE
jgi:hypothetical protein